MGQILSVWDALEPRKRVIAILAAIAMFAAVLGLARVASTPSLSLLYAGLDPATSGEIVASLDGRGIAYDVRGNAIYVDSSQRDSVRMALASEGLPANGVEGYELLDGLSGFGTTSQMFDAAYWRAKEGELARTLLATQNVRAARVHIANPVNRPFDRTTQPAASVIVTLNSGELNVNQAKAMRYLVASAVAGLSPDQVSVIDSVNGIVLAAGKEPERTALDDTTARAASMRTNIERLLAARVGAGRAIVEVNIDAELDSETVTERVLDPEGRVAISSDTEENTATSSGGNGGGVTVASNLPDGDVEGGGGNSNSSNSQTRERVNFEVSEVLRERIKRPGEIRRISVAVLVDGVTTVAEDGSTTWTPREDAEMTALRELVKSAIGFDEARGDVVTLETMEFTGVAETGTLAEAGMFDFLAVNAASIIQTAILGIVALVLGLFVLRPLLVGAPAELEGASAAGGPDGMLLPEDAANMLGEIEINPEALDDGPKENPNLDRLKSTITERAEDSSALLQSWLEDSAPKKESA